MRFFFNIITLLFLLKILIFNSVLAATTDANFQTWLASFKKSALKLTNKSFVDKAPNHIVEQEKNNYNELKSDIDKINLTIKSLE